MTERKPTATSEDQAPAMEQKPNASRASASASDAYRKLLARPQILADEDETLYMQLHDAIFDDVKPQSFLDKIAVKDLVDKLFEERRGKAAIVTLIEGARRGPPLSLYEPDERPYQVVQQYMPHVAILQRMLDKSEAGRRAIMKELRRKAEVSPTAKKPN